MADDTGVWVKVYPDAAGGAPGAAVIGDATADDPLFPVNTFSFTDGGQAFDVYEFLGSGQLVVDKPGVVDVISVGGGGAGSSGNAPAGGGGGAGSYLQLENDYLAENALVVVGGGGAKGAVNAPGKTGEVSRLGSLYGIGGGGGSARAGAGGNGASGGGGAGSDDPAGRVGGAGIDGIGKPGGTAGSNASAGGGGASQAGEDAPSTTPGKGGDGVDASSFIGQTADTLLLCGGGGGAAVSTGGAGGAGGGGTGGVNGGLAVDGEANTGGGGGGGFLDGCASGGSGIVIVRVKVASGSFGPRSARSAVRTAHAARIEDGIVRQVIVIPHLDDDDAKITEYCNRIGLPGTFVDTSYTGSRRGKYAGVGDSFDVKARSGEGEFVSPVTEIVEEA